MGWAWQAKCLLQSSVRELLHCAVVLPCDAAEPIPLNDISGLTPVLMPGSTLSNTTSTVIIESPSQHLAVTSAYGFLLKNPDSDITRKIESKNVTRSIFQ